MSNKAIRKARLIERREHDVSLLEYALDKICSGRKESNGG